MHRVAMLVAASALACVGRSEGWAGRTESGDPTAGDSRGAGPVFLGELFEDYTPPTYGTAPYSTAEFTPSANSTLVVCVMSCTPGTGQVTGYTYSDSLGLSWTRHVAVESTENFYEGGLYWYTAPVGPSPAAMTITVDATSEMYQWAIWIAEVDVEEPLSPVGVVGTHIDRNATGSLSYALAGTPGVASMVLAALAIDDNGPTTLDEANGWTELFEVGPDPGILFHVQIDEETPDGTVEYDDVTTSSSSDMLVAGAIELL